MTYSFARRVVDAVRFRPRAPAVQFTPEAVRGGNILYYWQWAYLGRERGLHRSVLKTDHMTAWLNEFPELEGLTVERSDVRIFDRRDFETRHHFGSSFTAGENLAFSSWLLNGSPRFEAHLNRARTYVTEETCVVNVRRGDYYNVPEFRAEFGMDIRAHVSQAVEKLVDLGRAPDDILIVSDDPSWCRKHLSDLFPFPVRYIPDRESMFDDLAALAASRTLVLANSTFSYWGSHFANVLQYHHLAIAPPFHQRISNGSLVDDLFDPRWLRTSLPTSAGQS